MEYRLYNLSEDVKNIFLAHKLVVVATYFPQSNILHRNKRPATSLFSDVSVKEHENGYNLFRGSELVAFVESGVGCDWVYHIGGKQNSSGRLLLVVGSENIDLFHHEPILEVTSENNIVTITNQTIINGKHWSEVENNADIQGFGCMWLVLGVPSEKYRDKTYITNGNVFDFNRGSGRLEFATLTKDETKKDLVDFFYSEDQIRDFDTERISFSMYHGLKATLPPIIIPLNNIFR